VGEDTGRSALFDETVSSYARLRDRSEKIIIDTLNSNVREALRPCRHMYVTQSGNASVEPASHTYFLLSSQKSLGDAQRLGRQSRAHGKSTHFSRTCAPRWVSWRALLRRRRCGAPPERCWRLSPRPFGTACLARYRFSTAGAAQLHAVLAAICRIVAKQVGPGVAEAGLRRCVQGARLVELLVKGDKDQAAEGEGEGGEEEWEAWGGGGEDAPKEAEGDTVAGEADLGLELP
jgi:hypothetical protein